MKTLRLFLCCLGLFVTSLSYADDLTPAQRTFQQNLIQFLKEEGFVPTIDEYNYVNFKKEGTNHWISISDGSPFYLEFHRSGSKAEDVDELKLLRAINEANRTTKCGKAYRGTTYVSYAIELYCHSIEEFKYTFYKCMSSLETVNNKVVNEYNKEETTQTSTTSTPSSSIIDKFFPAFGFSLEKSTLADLQSQGYTIEKSSGGYSHADVTYGGNTYTFWDFNKDNKLDYLSINHYKSLPAKWVNLGMSWNLSYNQWVNLFKQLGFTIRVKESPTVKTWKGREVLKAEIEARSPDGEIEFRLDFNYGNENGEGVSVTSPKTLYSILADTDA